MTLTEFLLARISEDEAVARACAGRFEPDADGPIFLEDPWPVEAAFVSRFTATRVLAECEAKRRIVEMQAENDEGRYAPGFHYKAQMIESVLRALAAVYADHPDYRDEWQV